MGGHRATHLLLPQCHSTRDAASGAPVAATTAAEPGPVGR